ncbi:hypothetical protein BIU73_04160 [Escherichia coli]|nr:hypothetical protein BIU73_04160 [Escherichia coli]
MWYREGTITFTQGSNTLVGAGTAWNVTANGVLPGMIVIGPDNKLYEIKRVISDTNIVLSEPYTGETQSEVPCRIITTYEGDLTQFSARFTALMSRMSADSKSMRSWLTALDEVTIEREDGTEVTVKPLIQIVNEHNENVEWYKNNTDAIDAAGDKAREAAASAAAAAESANIAGEKASQASQSASAAASSQSAASASATAAKKSETNAAASQKSAATSASTATTKASEAATSARDASASKEAAKSSETSAASSASSAASSATAAGNSAKAAKTSETNARSSETAAGQSASAAAGSKTAAASSASAASTSAGQASASATAAGKSAESAASSASTATTKAGEATEQASAAARSASAAKTSETNAKASETRAESSKTAAASSASSAASSASSASASKDEATRQASAAKSSATTASTKATEAAGSATAAAQSKSTAESAATRAETAAKRAEDIASAVALEDASTTKKGIVQLSSATNSTSETLAATPKAVKAANDNANGRVPSNRKVNGKALTADITLTPKDIGTLNSVTISFSGGAGWFKLATVTMPQASSIVYIALIGGAGYNVGSPHQAGISELVLRAGNGNPKGITGALWKRTAVGLTNFAWINTSGDTYDIYVEIGNYATSVNIHWDCTANATVSIYTSPTYSASKPSSVTDGVVYTMYSTHQKPTPLDIGALPTTGGTVSGPLSVTGGITGTLNGNASTATKLQTARSIGGVGFDGSANINLPGVNTTGNQNTTGNAATATKLQTARTIGGVSFDGTANINLPGVNTAGNQNTTGNAATATKLQTARNINGVKFDGSGDININTLVSRGQVTALSGSTQGTAGIQMYEAYSNNYPTSFGNVLHMKGASAAGEGELLIGWSGTSGAHAPVFIRSRRDVTDAAWSAWAQVYTTAHKPTAKDVGALPSGGGTLSGALTLSMVAPSVQLRGQGTDTRQYIMAYRTDGATSWYVGKANNGSDSAMLWNYTGANGIELAADGNVRINAKGKQFTFANNGNLGLVASLDQSSVPQGTYHQVALNTGTVGGKSYLRKFRGGNTDTIWHETVQGGLLRWATGNADEQEELSISTGYGVRARGEITSLSANGLRVAYGNYGFFIRNDGGTTYFMLTASGDKFGSWNALRPMYINNASGAVTMGNGLSLAGGLNVTSGNIRIPTSSTSWIDMRNNAALSNSSAVATSSASAIIRQEHADRHYFVGGLGNSQFGFYMINKSRTANGTDANAYLQNDGTWVCGGNGSFNDVYIRSDRRSKRNIRKIERALDKLEQIEGVLYEIQVCDRYEQSGGLIAQDVQNVQPELVTVDHNDQSGEPRLRLNYNGVIGMLVEAVKELREEVRELKAKM